MFLIVVLFVEKGMYKGNSLITSTITNLSYKTDKRLNCNDGGIYVVTGGCDQQYTGKNYYTL